MQQGRPEGMPLAVLAWLSNILFVAIPIIACFMVVAPSGSSSLEDAIFESHKVILIGAVTLSGVALVEAFLIALKLGTPTNLEHAGDCLKGIIVLLFAMFIGVICYLLALMNASNVKGYTDSLGFMIQAILGVWLLVLSVIIALKFKYIDYLISEFEAANAAQNKQDLTT